ncbi:FliM/FliN family flagellar motor switch protein [Rhodobacteraceae bacterium NNCM2]|nr:FliM/FliN family flagellar motor switch protein [Coraliihabitans acroporae]
MKTAVNVLSRKVAVSRVSRSPVAHLDMVNDAFAKILDEELWKILHNLTNTSVLSSEVRKLSQYLDNVLSPGLLAVIDVAGCKDGLLVNVSGALVNMVVDFRLGGNPMKSGAGEVRPVTEIDIAVNEAFIDRVLQGFTRAMAVGLEATDVPKLRLAGVEQYASLVNIAPDNADVLVIRSRIDVGAEAEGAEFDMVIPLSALDTFKSATRLSKVREEEHSTTDLWRDHMTTVASMATARLNGVLHTLKIEAKELNELAPGSVIRLPRQCLSNVQLTIAGGGAEPIAKGRLGNLDGQKAIKLIEPPDTALQNSVAKYLPRSDEPT